MKGAPWPEEKRAKQREKSRLWRERHHEEYLAKQRADHAACPEKAHERYLKYKAKYPERWRENARKAQAKAYKKDPALLNARTKIWREENPEHVAAYHKKYQEQNRDAILQRYRKYRERTKARWVEYHKEYVEQNRELVYAINRNYRARKYKAEGNHSGEDIQELYLFQDGLCAACHCKLTKSYHVDHIEPLSKGGSNHSANLQLLCQRCNGVKHAKTADEWMDFLVKYQDLLCTTN